MEKWTSGDDPWRIKKIQRCPILENQERIVDLEGNAGKRIQSWSIWKNNERHEQPHWRLYKARSSLTPSKRGCNFLQWAYDTGQWTKDRAQSPSSRSRILLSNSSTVSWTLGPSNQKQSPEVTSTDITLDQWDSAGMISSDRDNLRCGLAILKNSVFTCLGTWS